VFPLFILGFLASEPDPIVHIHEGCIRGTTLTSIRSKRPFFAFMGIPYAKPPVGELRFKVRETVFCSASKYPSFRVLKSLIVLQFFNKFPAFYGTPGSIIVLTKVAKRPYPEP
jgi:hypothetical protein